MIQFWNAFTGSFLILAGLSCVLLNASVLYVLHRAGFLAGRSNCSGVYILASGALLGDTMQQLITVLFVGPSSILQNYIVTSDDSRHPLVLGLSYLFLYMWYQTLIFQTVIALDRLLAIVFHVKSIPQRTYVLITVAVYVVCGVGAIFTQFVLPCCTCAVFYGTFGYIYVGEDFNYSDHYVDLPLNTSTTVIMAGCYFWIFLEVRSARKVADRSRIMGGQKQDVKIARQFGVVAAVLAFGWISFRVCPLVVPPTVPQLYALATTALIGHSASTAVIFLTMNTRFKRSYLLIMFGQKDAKVGSDSRGIANRTLETDNSTEPNTTPVT